jgi:rhomboid protease GluP
MYALLYVGGLLEKKFGKHRFLLVYIITGIFASIASISYNENIVSIGASGAIFGIYGLFVALLISKNYRIPEESRQNLISSILIFIGYNLFYGFTKEGIDNAAHIGGLVSGFIIGFAYYPAFRVPRYSKFISSGLIVVSLIVVFLMPKFIYNPAGEFQNVITEFTNNENKALWMYRETISNSPEKNQYYYDRLKNEGIELWDNNLKLLNSLSNLPPYLKERVDILTDYCNLRIESCRTMQSLIKYNNASDQEKLKNINILIESKINKLKELNK